MDSDTKKERPVKNRMRKTLIGYVPVESPIYHFHPLTRLTLFVVTGFIPIFINMPEVNLLFIAVIFVLFAFSRVDISKLKIYMPMLFTIGIFIFLTYWLAPGDNPENIEMGSFLGKPFYYQPLRWALVSYIRILALIFASIFYFSTNRETDILAGFRSAKIPFIVSYFIGVALRAAGMFLEDLHTIREAEQARGLDSTALGFRGKVKHYTMYMIPLFTLALRRGDEISNALFAKGYSFSIKTGKRADYMLSKYEMRRRDVFLIFLFIGGFFGIAFVSSVYDVFSVEKSLINQFFLKQ